MVSLSGLETRAPGQSALLAAELDRRKVPLTLLIAPRRMPEQTAHSAISGWVRERIAAGDEVALHGFGADTANRPAPTRLHRRLGTVWTSSHEAGLRLVAELAAMERLGLHADTFVTRRGLATPGTISALGKYGFSLCVDAAGVREIGNGEIHHGRVHALGQGARSEHRSGNALIGKTLRAARQGRLVRLAVDAAHLDQHNHVETILDAVDLVLDHDAVPTTYRGLVPARRNAATSPYQAPNRDALTS